MLSPDIKIFLVGFMGTGKTTLGGRLAGRLGWDFCDLDSSIEREEGASITRIFTDKGERYFRELERRVLNSAAASPGRAVIACGGGTFCTEDNQLLMQRCGITVWVDQPFDQIWRRRQELARQRPLLRGERELRELYETRLSAYRLAAHRLPVVEDDLDGALEHLLRVLHDRHAIS